MGFEACLHVQENQLTSAGSGRDNRNSLDIDIDQGTSSLGGRCNANTNTRDPIPIRSDGSFSKTVVVNSAWFHGTFVVQGRISGTTATGPFRARVTLFRRVHGQLEGDSVI